MGTNKQRIKQLEQGKPVAQNQSGDDIQAIVEALIQFINTEMVEPAEQNENKQTDAG